MTDNLCMTLPNLVEIHFHCFQNCRQVPSYSQLPFLRCLALGSLESVEYMEMSPHGIQSSPSTQTFFPSLQELDLRCMKNLKRWWDETEVKDCIDKEKISLKQSHLCPPSLLFSNLELLHIEDCPNLATLPLCTNVRQVILNKFNKQLNVLKKLSSSTVYSDAGSSATIPECSPRLKSLSVDDVDYLISLPEEHLGHITSLAIQDSNLLNICRLKEVFKQLSSLTHLKFSMCESLTLVSEGLEHLTLLNSLSFQDCGELDLSQNKGLEDGMPWKALNRLQLPQWISCFSSLESMQLYDCPKLTCLPEEFGKLSTLNELEILKCHGLTKRCRCPTGSDWPKIQHIPLLSVKERRYW
ncbi:uncharacterized protein LOC141588548 [Silene latifolia]|uniref:uncharacterized protein LOC141588548 n=1 Tax=Silene latifolia TaxID=37657 RepID=UPI003D789BEA